MVLDEREQLLDELDAEQIASNESDPQSRCALYAVRLGGRRGSRTERAGRLTTSHGT